MLYTYVTFRCPFETQVMCGVSCFWAPCKNGLQMCELQMLYTYVAFRWLFETQVSCGVSCFWARLLVVALCGLSSPAALACKPAAAVAMAEIMVMVVMMQKAVRQAEIDFQDSMLRIVSKLLRREPTANDAEIRIQLVQLLGHTYEHGSVEAALLAARAQQNEDEELRVRMLIQEAYNKQMAEENHESCLQMAEEIAVRRKRRRLRQATSPPDDTPPGDTAEAAAATAPVTAAACRRSGDRSRRHPD